MSQLGDSLGWDANETLKALGTWELRTIETNFSQNPSSLPTRHLAPGNLKLLHATCGLQVSFPVLAASVEP